MPVLGLSRGLPFYQMYPKGLSFSSLLFNCGGLVGDYGQDGRPIKDMQAVQFNGLDQYVDTPISFDSEYGVIETWVNTSTTSNDCIGGAYLPSPSRNRGYILIATITGFIQVGAGDDIIFSNTAVNDGLWHKIKVIFDSGSVDIYIDDHLDTSSSYTGSIISGLPMTLGSLNTGVSTVNHLDGQIAYASINGTIYSFQETSGSTVFDRSGGGNHATLINNPTRVIDNSAELADYDVVNTIGYSNGRGFDGSTQYVDTGQTIKTTDTEFHASMWIKPNESMTLRIFFSALHSGLDDIKLLTGLDNTIVYGVDDGTQDSIQTGISTTLNQWIEIYFGTTSTEMYFRCPTLNIDLTAPANFDFTSITDGRVAVAARPDGTIGAQCSIAYASINGTRIDLSDDSIMVNDPPLLVIPPSSNNDGLDALGNPLDVKGSAYPALPVPVGSKGLGFNGVDQYGEVTGDYSNLGNVTLHAILNHPTQITTAFLFAVGENHRRVYITNDVIYYGSGVTMYSGLPLNSYYKLELDMNSLGEATELRIDGIAVWSGVAGSSTSPTSEINIGWRKDKGQYFQGSIAHLEITGDTNLSIPFNNNSPYDLASDGTVVNYINNPTQVDQDVYHAELEDGFYKAVRGDGGSRIVTDVVDTDVVSIKARFIYGEASGTIMGLGAYTPSSFMRLYFTGGTMWATIGSSSNYVVLPLNASNIGEEHEVEIFTNGDVFLDGVYSGNTGGTYVPYSTQGYACFLSNLSWFQSNGSNAIILQGWVNGQEIDIHDTNMHVGTIETHRLVGYSELTNPAIPKGHNDANTGFNLTHLTEGGNTPPAITATGQDVQDYRFGDSLTNPLFKRVLSPVGEDRHSLFKEPLTGACLGKAQGFFSIGFPYSFPIQLS